MSNISFTEDELSLIINVLEQAVEHELTNRQPQVLALSQKMKAMILAPDSLEARVIQPLLNAGLAAKLTKTHTFGVVGGRRSNIIDGITMFEESFSIWEDEKTHLFYAGKAKANVGFRSDAYVNVDDAVAWVIGVYNGSIKENPNKDNGISWVDS